MLTILVLKQKFINTYSQFLKRQGKLPYVHLHIHLAIIFLL